jgi:hypothetical protein
MVDLVAKYTPFLDGKAHDGMVQAAQCLHRVLMPTLLRLLQARPHSHGRLLVVFFKLMKSSYF